MAAIAAFAMALPAAPASGEEGYNSDGEGFVVTSAGLLLTPTESPIAVGPVIMMLGGAGELVWSKDLEWSGGGYSGFVWNDIRYVRSAAVVEGGFVAVGELVEKYDAAGSLLWQGGSDDGGMASFYSVAAVDDGFVAVGEDRDGGGTVTRFDGDGEVIWEACLAAPGKRFVFQSVAAAPDGIYATGYSHDATQFDDDWSPSPRDAVIAKFSYGGSLLWSSANSTLHDSVFCSVAAVPGGAVAVGGSAGSPLIARYGDGGALLWEKGVAGVSSLLSVTAVPSGFATVGETNPGSLFDRDAFIAVFDETGDIVWQEGFGGADDDSFRSVAAVEGGIVAVGHSYPGSFGNGDLAGIESKSTRDTVIAMFDYAGGVGWVENTPWSLSAAFGSGPDFSGLWFWIGVTFIVIGLAFAAAYLFSAGRQGARGA